MNPVSGGWTVRLSVAAVKDKYKIQRGEAANFRDAVAILRQGIPEDATALHLAANTYEYQRNGYFIAFEVLPEKTIRVLYFTFAGMS